MIVDFFSFGDLRVQARVYELLILEKYQKFLLTSENAVLPTRTSKVNTYDRNRR